MIGSVILVAAMCACGIGQSYSDADMMEAIEKTEYALLLSEVEQSAPGIMSWQLQDGDKDGDNELYVEVKNMELTDGEVGGLYLLADYNNQSFWTEEDAGSFGGTEWVENKAGSQLFRLRYHNTAGAPLRQYSVWNGEEWAVFCELNGFDYDDTVCNWRGEDLSFEEFYSRCDSFFQNDMLFQCQELNPIEVSGTSKRFVKEYIQYWKDRNGFLKSLTEDIDHDGKKETVIFLTDIMNNWCSWEIEDNSESFPEDAYRKNTQAIIVKESKKSAVINCAGFDTATKNISFADGGLVLDGVPYVYKNGTFRKKTDSDDSFSMGDRLVAIEDEDLLRIANEKVLEQYNFVYYLQRGAFFEQSFENASNDFEHPWYKVTDSRIHSFADIRDVWYSYFAKESDIPDEVFSAYKEEAGYVYTANSGVGDNFTDIELTKVETKSNDHATLNGTLTITDPLGEKSTQNVSYIMIFEDGEWKCEEISVDGKTWSFG